MCMLPYLKRITNKDLLYSTRNSAQCSAAAWMGKGLGGEWIHVYVWLSPFAIHLNYHSIVNRLYPNTKKKLEKEEFTNLQCELLNFSASLETGTLPVCLLLGTHACLYFLTASRMTICTIFIRVYIASTVSCWDVGITLAIFGRYPALFPTHWDTRKMLKSNVRKLNSTIRNVGQHYAFSALRVFQLPFSHLLFPASLV